MKEETIIQKLAQMNRDYCQRLQREIEPGKEYLLAEAVDEYGNFLCDAVRALFGRAKKIETLADTYPDCIVPLLQIAHSLRAYATLYSEGYKKIERLQRNGILPTLLDKFEIGEE